MADQIPFGTDNSAENPGDELASDFCTAASFVVPTLTPRGDTP